jgi:SAM-dependent methyltransferase
MPIPSPQLISCGDGDFRTIGAEFLARVVHATGLAPSQRVLDIGCGIGRLALPMTQYLDEAGSYDGVDPILPAIAWCVANISAVYPNMRFHHMDVSHPIYNTNGTLDATAVRLPFEDETFDVVCMISVLTHLHTAEVLRWASETARVLAPGGCCFATGFLMNGPARAALTAGEGRIGFDPSEPGPIYESNPNVPLAGVAFDEDFLVEKFLRHGLRRRIPAEYGQWSGRAGSSFQDICIFEKG